MVASTPLNHTFADHHDTPWTEEHASAYQKRDGGLPVHTQSQTPLHASGLPSPVPSGPGASPPTWPDHGISTISGTWAPASPISPVLGEGMNRGFSHPLDTLACAAMTVAPPTSYDPDFHAWPETNMFPVLNNTYPAVLDTQSLLHHVMAGFPAPPWARPPPLIAHPDKQFLAADIVHAATPVAPARSGPSLERTPSGSDQQHPPLPLTAHLEPLTDSTPPPPPPAQQQRPNPKLHPQPPPPPPPSHSPPSNSSGSGSGPTLRTAARRVKRATPPAPKPGESPAHQRARANHNMVEQQYRQRLHARFEALLDALPGEGVLLLEEGGSGGGGGKGGVLGKSGKGGGGSGKQRRMSKVDVLNRAARTIRFLEGDVERTRKEVEALRLEREMSLASGHGGAGRGMGREEWARRWQRAGLGAR